jgi:flagellar hook-basal body complex protein FliE
MMIDKIGLISKPVMNTDNVPAGNISASQLSGQFGQFLNGAMEKLNEQQMTVDKLNQQFVKGELSDVHQLMIASEKASIGLQLTVQVRNKVVEAYQEIMRMQI